MKKLYEGKASIVSIDVWKNQEQVERFGLWLIPTQIYFNSDGEEVYRHTGFVGEKDIIAQLEKTRLGR